MSSTKKPATPVRREDRPGHLDPAYAASLRALSDAPRDLDTKAFVDGSRSGDDLAEELAENAVTSMTSGEDGLADDLAAVVDEESGGPFVESNADKEYADGIDGSNPSSAFREPFPKT